MGVFYNPPPPVPVTQMFSQPLGGGFSPGARPRAKGRDVQAEKWDKQKADEKLFDDIVAENTNPDTGEVAWDKVATKSNLNGLSKEASAAIEQDVNTKKASLEQSQKAEMEQINDQVQALHLVTSGSPSLHKRGMAILQKYDPDIVDVTQADKDGYYFYEHRADGSKNKVSAEKVWKALMTAKENLTLKQGDDQFRFRLTVENKILTPDKLKGLALSKKLGIDAKIQHGIKLNPNDPVDNLTQTEQELIDSVIGKNPYIAQAASTLILDPTFRITVLENREKAVQEVIRSAQVMEQADKASRPKTTPLGKDYVTYVGPDGKERKMHKSKQQEFLKENKGWKLKE